MLILFPACLIKNLLGKTVLVSCHLKLRLPVFLKCFLISPNFSRMFLIDIFLIKQTFYCYSIKINSK